MSKPTGIPITPKGMENTFHAFRYFAQALDPIHIGTGGERLSRVDMAIVREAGTDLPKLPGTSLSGACRAYAALQAKRQRCAGQGQTKKNEKGETIREEHCGETNCPICRTFGYARGANDSKKGAAQFTDAHIVAFPVASTNGPLWVTSPGALTQLGLTTNASPKEDIWMRKARWAKETATLGLGWLALEIKGIDFGIKGEKVEEQITFFDGKPLSLVSDTLFTTIVNDNLEVRTSVAINPGTGAAEDGALFTYEAIPTGTLFAWDVMYQGKEEPAPSVFRSTVEDGFALFAWLGVGGMNTRGMGRLAVK